MADHFPHLPRAKAGLIRDLCERKRTRDHEQAFVVEGVHPVVELLRKQSPAVSLIATSCDFLRKQPADVVRVLLRSHAPVYEVNDASFDRLSDVESAQGILAIVKKPVWSERAVFHQPQIFGLFGEHIQDPGNVGTLIRLAVALGISGLWLTRDSADVFNPKVVRATAGAVLSLPIFHCSDSEHFDQHQCAVLASESPSSESMPIREIHSIPARTIVAVGNESRGLAKRTLDSAALRVHIPLQGNVDSLNVAVAAAIILFHLSGLPREP
ncbi:MAG: TrmH family RNA methyltransferase [Nitrospiraceae bacterium]